MYTEEIHNLVNKKFEEEGFQEYFLVGIEQNGKNISVFIDSDKSVSFDICKTLSRYLETILDEKAWFGKDYVLEISSAGLSRPLVFPRQFIKNKDRHLEVEFQDNSKLIGVISEAGPEEFTLTFEETRKEGKKKIIETIHKVVPYSTIKAAKIIARI